MSVTYTSGSAESGEYFGWRDSSGDDARELALKFVTRFPALASAGDGWDYAYAGWFQHLLGLAERGWFPEVGHLRKPPAWCVLLPLIGIGGAASGGE